MYDPLIAVVRDRDGLIHYSARDSEFVQDGLRNGSLVDTEATDAPTDAQDGDDLDAGAVGARSGNRKRQARNANDGDGSGVAESASDS